MITERSVIIPAFDEVGSLPDLLWKLDGVLDGLEGRSEVIVVDDGSSDGTAAVVAALGLDRVRVIRLLVNRGKSHALRTGLEAAVGEVIVLMDADGQDDPTEIPRLLAALEDHELVTGRRTERRDGFMKRTTSRLYNRATGWVTGIDGRDFNSGLKVMRSWSPTTYPSTASCTATSPCWRRGPATGSARSTSSTVSGRLGTRSSATSGTGAASSTS